MYFKSEEEEIDVDLRFIQFDVKNAIIKLKKSLIAYENAKTIMGGYADFSYCRRKTPLQLMQICHEILTGMYEKIDYEVRKLIGDYTDFCLLEKLNEEVALSLDDTKAIIGEFLNDNRDLIETYGENDLKNMVQNLLIEKGILEVVDGGVIIAGDCGSAIEGKKGELNIPINLRDNGDGTTTIENFANNSLTLRNGDNPGEYYYTDIDGNDVKFEYKEIDEYSYIDKDGNVVNYKYDETGQKGVYYDEEGKVIKEETEQKRFYFEVTLDEKHFRVTSTEKTMLQPASKKPDYEDYKRKSGGEFGIVAHNSNNHFVIHHYDRDQDNKVVIFDLGGLSDKKGDKAPGVNTLSGDCLGNIKGIGVSHGENEGGCDYMFINSDAYNKTGDEYKEAAKSFVEDFTENDNDKRTIVVNAASGGGFKEPDIVNELNDNNMTVDLKFVNEAVVGPDNETSAETVERYVGAEGNTDIKTATVIAAGTSDSHGASEPTRTTGMALSGKNNTLFLKVNDASHAIIQRAMNNIIPNIIQDVSKNGNSGGITSNPQVESFDDYWNAIINSEGV